MHYDHLSSYIYVNLFRLPGIQSFVNVIKYIQTQTRVSSAQQQITDAHSYIHTLNQHVNPIRLFGVRQILIYGKALIFFHTFESDVKIILRSFSNRKQKQKLSSYIICYIFRSIIINPLTFPFCVYKLIKKREQLISKKCLWMI